MGGENTIWRVFEAEQAAQLALKSLLYELLGMAPRIHGLGEAGLEGPAGLVAEAARAHRQGLWLLEDAYYRGRYGLEEYTQGEAALCLEAARAVLGLVEEVRRTLAQGEA